MTNTECGFYALNGQHCILADHCVVCRIPSAPELPKLTKGQVITLSNFGAADGTYKIIDLRNSTLSLEYIKV